MNQMDAEIEEDIVKNGMCVPTRSRRKAIANLLLSSLTVLCGTVPYLTPRYAHRLDMLRDNSCKHFWVFALVSLSLIS
jgi:hypothetical protein